MAPNYYDGGDDIQSHFDKYRTTGPERYFELQRGEVFDSSDFTLIFIDSDSVTNVTSLNRVNQRRVLIFIGNGHGLISFGKGKGEDYEHAFDNAFKKMRQNMTCISLDQKISSMPTRLAGHHNDFMIKLYPR